MVQHSCETIGYYSRVDGEVVDPIFTTLNVEEIKKINKDGIPLDISHQIPLANNRDKIGNLVKFLEDKNVFDEQNDEFNVIALGKGLHALLFMNKNDRDAKEFKFYKHFNDDTYVIEECHSAQSYRVSDEYQLFTDNGQVAEVLLALLPDGTMEEEHEAHALTIVVKHRFVLTNDRVINLYVSKGIHSVIKKDKEMIPVHLKYSSFHAFSTKEMLQKCRAKRLLYNYLVGGLCSLVAIASPNNQDVVEKVFLIDDLSVLCDAPCIIDMKMLLPYFLETIVGVNSGTLNKCSFVMKYRRPYQDIVISNEDGKLVKAIGAVSTFVPYSPSVSYEPKDHELVIVGTYKGGIPYMKHFYNADFISLKHFCDGTLVDLLKKPKWIRFYGTVDEYETVQDHLDDDQIEKLSFVESRYNH